MAVIKRGNIFFIRIIYFKRIGELRLQKLVTLAVSVLVDDVLKRIQVLVVGSVDTAAVRETDRVVVIQILSEKNAGEQLEIISFYNGI